MKSVKSSVLMAILSIVLGLEEALATQTAEMVRTDAYRYYDRVLDVYTGLSEVDLNVVMRLPIREIMVYPGADAALFSSKKHFPQLKEAILKSNNPTHLKQLADNYSNLEFLCVVNDAALDDDAVRSLIMFKKLQVLELSCNVASPDLLKASSFPKLEVLVFESNLFEGESKVRFRLPTLYGFISGKSKLSAGFLNGVFMPKVERMLLINPIVERGAFLDIADLTKLTDLTVTLPATIDDTDTIIMADDLAHLCANPSTIYNTFSSLVHEGKLKRSANGIYVKQYREQPSVDEIVDRKARRFGRRVKPGKQHHDEHHTEIRHKYWTNGRTTSFKLLSGGKPYATVLLQEQCRATAEKKRKPAQTIERSAPGTKAIQRAQYQTTETDSPASCTNSDSPNRVGWWHLVRRLTSQLLQPFENCLTMVLHQDRILPNEPKSSIMLSSELPPQFPHAGSGAGLCRTANMRARLSCSYNSLHNTNKDSLHRNYQDLPP